MKKILLSFLVIIISGILGACSNDTNSSQEIISNYPETIKQEIEELPEDFRKSLVVPSKLPKSYSVINFSYTSEPMNDPTGNIINTTFIYEGENTGYHLVLNTMYGDVDFANEKRGKTVTLDNGIKAKVIDEYAIRWVDENENHQELSFIVPDLNEAKVTKDDLVEVANSMK